MVRLFVEEKKNTIVCCNDLHSRNLLASALKKELVKKISKAIFYSDNEFEKFIADSLIDEYGKAFSELAETESSDTFKDVIQTILIMKTGEKLGGNEIFVLNNLLENANHNKNQVIIFFNSGLSPEKVEQKINKFGSSFYIYDAKDIKIKDNKAGSEENKDQDLNASGPGHSTAEP